MIFVETFKFVQLSYIKGRPKTAIFSTTNRDRDRCTSLRIFNDTFGTITTDYLWISDFGDHDNDNESHLESSTIYGLYLIEPKVMKGYCYFVLFMECLVCQRLALGVSNVELMKTTLSLFFSEQIRNNCDLQHWNEAKFCTGGKANWWHKSHIAAPIRKAFEGPSGELLNTNFV